MVLGLLPAIRGGLGELAKTGQHARLIDGYLTPYARAFETVRYFSYLVERLGDLAEVPDRLPGARAGREVPADQARALPGPRAPPHAAADRAEGPEAHQ